MIPEVTLLNGVKLPQFGLGVATISPETTAALVAEALRAGYRHIDTAQMYGNEREVAVGIELSGVDPADVFVTSKLTTAMHRFDDVLRGFDRSAQRMGEGTIDLYLIHWPLPRVADLPDTWRGFEQLLSDGRVRAIGVSNFSEEHIAHLRTTSTITPAVNQVELHPYFSQRPLDSFHKSRGIVTEAWAPLAQGAVFNDPTIAGIAQENHRTIAQIVVRWHIQHGNVLFPRTTKVDRLKANLEVFDFELTEEEMLAIDGLHNDEGRLGPAPDDVNDEVVDPRAD
jgi:2,5-diketo-D-gluconate reductase A